MNKGRPLVRCLRFALGEVAEQLKHRYTDSAWALKSSVWSQ
jgi:hypothetical protein